jgi:hypothetical protein
MAKRLHAGQSSVPALRPAIIGAMLGYRADEVLVVLIRSGRVG